MIFKIMKFHTKIQGAYMGREGVGGGGKERGEVRRGGDGEGGGKTDLKIGLL